MLPSSNLMGADEKLDSGSQIATRVVKRFAEKGNHSGRPSGWLATPAEHRSLSSALQFLIANLELEFTLSPERISNLRIVSRKFMTILHSGNWAASDLRRAQRANLWEKTVRSSEFLIATFDISEKYSDYRKHRPKQISNSNRIHVLAFSPPRAVTQIRGSVDA